MATKPKTTTLNFRKLTANEIECRVGIAKEKGCSLLLYKDARCDRKILNETVGPYNWQRHHNRDNANCIVSLWDESKQQWIEKEDVGTESNTEAEKGLASDSFKRACFNWGIGEELYTAPFIWIPASKYDNQTRNGKYYPNARFKVLDIHYDADGRIDGLKITNEMLESENKIVFSFVTSELAEQLKQKLADSKATRADEIVNAFKNEES